MNRRWRRWAVRVVAAGVIVPALLLLVALRWLPADGVERAAHRLAARAGVTLETLDVAGASLQEVRVNRVAGRAGGVVFDVRGLVLRAHPRGGGERLWSAEVDEVVVDLPRGGAGPADGVRAPGVPALRLAQARIARVLVRVPLGETGVVPLELRALHVAQTDGALDLTADVEAPGVTGVAAATWEARGVRGLALDLRVDAVRAGRMLADFAPSGMPVVDEGNVEVALRGDLGVDGAFAYNLEARPDNVRVRQGDVDVRWTEGVVRVRGDASGLRGVVADALAVDVRAAAFGATFRGRAAVQPQATGFLADAAGTFDAHTDAVRVSGNLAMTAELGERLEATVQASGLNGAGLPVALPPQVLVDVRRADGAWRASLAPLVLDAFGARLELGAVEASWRDVAQGDVRGTAEVAVRASHPALRAPVAADVQVAIVDDSGRLAVAATLQLPAQRIEAVGGGGTVAVELGAAEAQVRWLGGPWMASVRAPWSAVEVTHPAGRASAGEGEVTVRVRALGERADGEPDGVFVDLGAAGVRAEAAGWRAENIRVAARANGPLDPAARDAWRWDAAVSGLRVRRVADDTVLANRIQFRAEGSPLAAQVEGTGFVRGTDLQPAFRGSVLLAGPEPAWRADVDLASTPLLDWGALADLVPALAAWEVAGQVAGRVEASGVGAAWSARVVSAGGPVRLRATEQEAEVNGIRWEVEAAAGPGGLDSARGAVRWDSGSLGDIVLGAGEVPFAYADGAVRVGEARVVAFGGTIVSEPVAFELANPGATGVVRVEDVALGALLAAFPDAPLGGEGRLSGAVPFSWGASSGIGRGELLPTVDGARLRLPLQDGWLRGAQTGMSAQVLDRVEDALAWLRVERVLVVVAAAPGGGSYASLRFEGAADALDVRAPVTLELNYSDALGTLLGLMGAR